MANVEEMGDLGVPGQTENTESVNTELPTQSVTRSGRVSKVPERFRDYICSEVKDSVTQKPRPSADVHLIPDADIAETDELSFHAATLRYLRLGVQPLVQKQGKTNVDI